MAYAGEGTCERPFTVNVGDKALKAKQMHDKTIMVVLEWFELGKPSRREAKSLNEDTRVYWNKFEMLSLVGDLNILCLKVLGNTGKYCLPEEEWTAMLKMTHDNPTGAHTGSKKCLEKIRANYWFPNCSKIVEFYTRSCEKCFYVNISYKASPKAVQLPMTASYPNQQVHIDILGPLSRQASYKYIVTYK